MTEKSVSASSLLSSVLPVICAAGLLWVGSTIQNYGIDLAKMSSDLDHMNRNINTLSDERQRLSRVIQDAELRREETKSRLVIIERRISRMESDISRYKAIIRSTKSGTPSKKGG